MLLRTLSNFVSFIESPTRADPPASFSLFGEDVTENNELHPTYVLISFYHRFFVRRSGVDNRIPQSVDERKQGA